MPFEKSKVIKAAEKFLAQGKIKDAIKEYRQIIEHDNADLTTLNMMGDLLARAGEKDEAVSCFTRIADHYHEQDFTLKAIAMYKKIEKLKPRDPQTASKLAALYSNQGLVVDARAQWLVVADAYTRAGEPRKALKVLHKIADLDPNNTEIRLKLAEGYLKEKMQPDAAKAFAEAARQLLERGAFDKSLAANTNVLELFPFDLQALKGVVSAHVAMGTADEAAGLLEKAVDERPDEPELVSMLAQAYIDAENPAGAERAVATMMSQDSSNYRRYIEVARLYLKTGAKDEAARVLGLIVETMLAAREENDLLELLKELLYLDPAHVAGLRLLSRVHWWQRDMDTLRSTLERLAEASEAAGLLDDERYALTQLIRLAPDEPRYLERLNVIGGFSEEMAEASQVIEEPSPAAVPTFEGFDIVTDAAAEIDAPVSESTTAEFEWNSVAQEGVTDPGASFADLNEPDEAEATEQELHFSAEAADQVRAQPLSEQEEAADKHHAIMMQELESVDFYLAQGYSDIAIDTLELLKQQFGAHPEIEARRAKLNSLSPSAERTSTVEISGELLGGASEVGHETAPPVAVPQTPLTGSSEKTPSGIDSGLAEIFEEFRVEAEGEHASSNEDYETHYNMATAYKEMDLLDEAIREFQTATGLTGPADGTPRFFQCCNMLGHCFVQKGMPQAAVLWFKKGLEAPGRSTEEYKALQYELGSAYEQMGDFGRAIGVFTEVYGLDVGYRDVADKLKQLQAQRKSSGKRKKGK
jgi:tetratricopeptide (TPR) repeat protein